MVMAPSKASSSSSSTSSPRVLASIPIWIRRQSRRTLIVTNAVLLIVFLATLCPWPASTGGRGGRDDFMGYYDGKDEQFYLPPPATTTTTTTTTHRPLLTVKEIKQQMQLPCNYVHDGFYIADSNEILNQVYQTLTMSQLDDDVVPILVECGGHDGITKSQTLKASRCLAVNTLLIEASPTNYRVLQRTRGAYDWTVHAALCDGDGSIEVVENVINSGEMHIVRSSDRVGKTTMTATATCTSIDAELDKLAATLPPEQRSKVQLIFLVLDVEGYEATAIHGITKYAPHKVFMEEKHLQAKDRQQIAAWAARHNLKARGCGPNRDDYNFGPLLGQLQQQSREYLKALFYGARTQPVKHSVRTNIASQSYMFYGQ